MVNVERPTSNVQLPTGETEWLARSSTFDLLHFHHGINSRHRSASGRSGTWHGRVDCAAGFAGASRSSAGYDQRRADAVWHAGEARRRGGGGGEDSGRDSIAIGIAESAGRSLDR